MAFVHGRGTILLVDIADLSAYFNTLDVSSSVDIPDTSVFSDTARTRKIVGLKDGSLSLSGFFDGAANAVDAKLQAAIGSAGGEVISAAQDTLVIGKPVKLVLSRLTSYDLSSPVDGVVSAAASIQADGGIDHGKSQHALASESATGNAASVDNAAGTTNGGIGHLHVTANTRNNATTIKVQHSTDDIVWADLLTFADVSTTTTQERKAVAAGTTVNRYTRATWTFAATPTGALTFAVGFARR